jgi:hypothetical protein
MFRPIRVIIRSKRIMDVGHSPFMYFASWWPLCVEICSDLYGTDSDFIIKTVVYIIWYSTYETQDILCWKRRVLTECYTVICITTRSKHKLIKNYVNGTRLVLYSFVSNPCSLGDEVDSQWMHYRCKMRSMSMSRHINKHSYRCWA